MSIVIKVTFLLALSRGGPEIFSVSVLLFSSVFRNKISTTSIRRVAILSGLNEITCCPTGCITCRLHFCLSTYDAAYSHALNFLSPEYIFKLYTVWHHISIKFGSRAWSVKPELNLLTSRLRGTFMLLDLWL